MNYLSDKYNLEEFNYFTGKTYIDNRYPNISQYLEVCLNPDGTIIPLSSSQYNQEEKRSCVIYFGNFNTQHFGNILIDYMSRLWYEPKISYYQWVYTSERDISKNVYFMYLLKLLGINGKNVVRITEPTCFSQILIPEQSFVHDKYILPIFCNIYERIYNNFVKTDMPIYNKIYLTRTHLKRHKEIGEKRFERFFAANGYKVIALEEFSLMAQATIIRNAKHIASLEGTHAHGIVWREQHSEGEQVVLRKQKEVIPRQMMLNALWNIQTTFIDVFEEPYKGFPISHDRGPFLLRWTSQIDQYANNNNMVVPPECRKGYRKDFFIYMIKCVFYKMIHILKQFLI